MDEPRSHPSITGSADLSGRADTECPVCRQLVLEGADEHHFLVAPIDGGGWALWSNALLRLITRHGAQPTQAFVITQPSGTQRYVQFQLGHGLAHAEVSSNVYLTGDDRLGEGDEALLAELGWSPPACDRDDPEAMPANWSLPLVHGDWRYLVEMLVATLVGVLDFSEHLPVDIRSFTCHRPCRDCSWPAAA